MFPALLIPLISSGQSPVEARQELERLNIPYSEEEFIARAREVDTGVVELFLVAGMDPNTKRENDVTPLMVAAQEGYVDTVRVLLNAGADVNAQYSDGGTALMLAAQEGYINTVQVLLNAGADVNAQYKDGVTALMLAAARGHATVVKVLLYEGGDVNAKDKNSLTALRYAKQNMQTHIVQLLRETGVEEPKPVLPGPESKERVKRKMEDKGWKKQDRIEAVCPEGLEGFRSLLMSVNPYDVGGRCFKFIGERLQILGRTIALFYIGVKRPDAEVVLLDFGFVSVPGSLVFQGLVRGEGAYEYLTTLGAVNIVPRLHVIKSSLDCPPGVSKLACVK